MNWLDIVFLVVLGLTLVIGLIKGLVKQAIGLAAVVIGFLLASLYYLHAAWFLRKLISSEIAANLIGFLLIFFVVVALGTLLSFLLSKLMKGPLAFINRVLGGLFGLIKGVLICGVIVFAFLVFDFEREALNHSALAPYCFQITKGIVALIPQSLKEKFKTSYQEFRSDEAKNGQKI